MSDTQATEAQSPAETTELTPAQKAAQTRAANKAAKAAEDAAEPVAPTRITSANRKPAAPIIKPGHVIVV